MRIFKLASCLLLVHCTALADPKINAAFDIYKRVGGQEVLQHKNMVVANVPVIKITDRSVGNLLRIEEVSKPLAGYGVNLSNIVGIYTIYKSSPHKSWPLTLDDSVWKTVPELYPIGIDTIILYLKIVIE